ncbi:MAG: hypothetical protein WBM65_15810 [Sedimenticolaceae bacterium]
MRKTLTITLLITLLLPNTATSGIADEVAERMWRPAQLYLHGQTGQ